MNRIHTAESVSEGHPDKVCDFIADSILDAHVEQDPRARVACEVLCKSDIVIVAGEITSTADVDVEKIVRQVVTEIGYTDPTQPFNAQALRIEQYLTRQAAEIARGVGRTEQGAGDQGIMFGYATNETRELMPLPILLAHQITRGLASDRHAGTEPWLRPDAKTQVSIRYEGSRPVELTSVLVSTQHAPETQTPDIEQYLRERLLPRVLGDWYRPELRLQVNSAGSFEQGGPSADCGVTGRKVIADTYGGAAHHGGGAFSGKDPSKVDRSGAYFCRYVARQLVLLGLAERAEVNVAYAIGLAEPLSVGVDTLGSGDDGAAHEFVSRFDFRPAAIIEHLDLLRPIYRRSTNYGHFGRPALPWEGSELRELAWEFDPLAIRKWRDSTEDEYECLVDFILPRLRAGIDANTLAQDLDGYRAEHFGDVAGLSGARELAAQAVAWYGEPRR